MRVEIKLFIWMVAGLCTLIGLYLRRSVQLLEGYQAILKYVALKLVNSVLKDERSVATKA